MNQPLPFIARTEALITAIVMADEESWTKYGTGVTDSGILDEIDAWSTDQCDEGCTTDDCCDYQRLNGAVWAWIASFETGTINGR